MVRKKSTGIDWYAISYLLYQIVGLYNELATELGVDSNS